MSVHLVNPSDNSFGTAVITPRWLFVLAAATRRRLETRFLWMSRWNRLFRRRLKRATLWGSACTPGMRCADTRWAGWRGAVARGGVWGIHATLFPEEALERGEAHAVVKGDGDIAWGPRWLRIAWRENRSAFMKAGGLK